MNSIENLTGLSRRRRTNRKVSGFTNPHALPNQLQRKAKSLIYAVVLKNRSKLCSPEQRKQFVDRLCLVASKDIETKI